MPHTPASRRQADRPTQPTGTGAKATLKRKAACAAGVATLAAIALTLPIPGHMTLPPRDLLLVDQSGNVTDTGFGVMLVSKDPAPSLIKRIEAATSPIWSRIGVSLTWALDGSAGDTAQLEARIDSWYIANAYLGKPVGVALQGELTPAGLYPGDIVVSINGQPVSPTVLANYFHSPSGVVRRAMLRRENPHWSNERIRRESQSRWPNAAVEVVRGGRTVKLSIEPAAPSGAFSWAGKDNPYSTPTLTRVSGTSAGLGLGLAYIEMLTGIDINGQYRVAATGTLQLGEDGQAYVGEINGIAAKIRGAVEAGYDIAVVPATQEREAREAAHGSKLRVIGVGNLPTAIKELCKLSAQCAESGRALTPAAVWSHGDAPAQ